MQVISTSALAARLRAALIVGTVLCAALVVYGLLLHPAIMSASPTALQSLIAAISILVIYGLLATFWLARVERTDSHILHWAVRLGLICGAIFAVEMISEYILLPQDNTAFGQIEFGSVFFLYFAVSLIVTFQTNKIRYGMTASIWCAVIASVIWLIAVLGILYIFYGTPQQAQVLRAEGTYEDFRRSGMSDFQAFVIEDFWGATFFHLLFGPIFGAGLGLLGGLIGKGVRRLFRSRI